MVVALILVASLCALGALVVEIRWRRAYAEWVQALAARGEVPAWMARIQLSPFSVLYERVPLRDVAPPREQWRVRRRLFQPDADSDTEELRVNVRKISILKWSLWLAWAACVVLGLILS